MSSSRIDVGLISDTKTITIGIDDKKIEGIIHQGGALIFPYDVIQKLYKSIKSKLSQHRWEQVVIVRCSEFSDFIDAQENDLEVMRGLVKEWIETKEGAFYKKEIKNSLINDVIEVVKELEGQELDTRFKSELWEKFKEKNGNILGEMLKSFHKFLLKSSVDSINNSDLHKTALAELFYDSIVEKQPDFAKDRR